MADFPQIPTSLPAPMITTITNVITGDGVTSSFTLTMYAKSIITVTIDDVEVSDYTLVNGRYSNIVFTTAPALNSTIVVTFLYEFPQTATGYIKPATDEDLVIDASGVTYPNLHRRIDESKGLYVSRIVILGMPILYDDSGLDNTLPDNDSVRTTIKEHITNAYDVKLITLGNYVKDYIVDYITGECKFMWIIRTSEKEIQYSDGYDMLKIVDEVYRDPSHPILQPNTLDYQVSAQIDASKLLCKDTYNIYATATSSFRTTEHHTHDENSNSEIP